eukprot:Lithocolla_globosa_v1_NODE_317_length_4525_cov_21.771812.p2 type:complete len:139 gc:universal NODE_317_length_4525_cov_21.771812:4431-4015(-)
MKKLNVYNTKITNHYQTPPDLYKRLDSEFHFNHDPCPLHGEEVKCGLLSSWNNLNSFVNPPYSNVESWAKKCVEEQKNGNLSVMLIPSRTSTNYFHKYILPNAELRFIKGRISFLNEEGVSRGPAPFASMLCIFRPES